ncbi:MAG: DNA replication/repair protein RecF [Clostridia bacterium]|nr:DNA replication/repair protein RecF [Clostridia bacterium]
MEVTTVELQNFLSYTQAKVFFDKGLNVVYGQNAAGKTNLIDSVYLCSVGRSSRHNRDKDLIKWGADAGAKVTLTVKKRFSKHTIEFYVDVQGKKHILVDKLPIAKIGELMGILNVVFFSPQEIRLIKESPADRRRFMDIGISQQCKTYFYALQRYNALLVQRNKILKTYKGRPSLDSMLEIVDTDFIKVASYIIKERKKFVEEIAPVAAERHDKLTDGKEKLTMLYETESVDYADVEGSLKALLKQTRENDCRLEYTTVGPHRDDIKIAANGVDLRRFGSQGQQRSAVLSLKLAEIASFEKRTGERPILLLDDVMSELDLKRRTALFEAIEGIQTIITCTDKIEFPVATYFNVQDQRVIKI